MQQWVKIEGVITNPKGVITHTNINKQFCMLCSRIRLDSGSRMGSSPRLLGTSWNIKKPLKRRVEENTILMTNDVTPSGSDGEAERKRSRLVVLSFGPKGRIPGRLIRAGLLKELGGAK